MWSKGYCHAPQCVDGVTCGQCAGSETFAYSHHIYFFPGVAAAAQTVAGLGFIAGHLQLSRPPWHPRAGFDHANYLHRVDPAAVGDKTNDPATIR